MLIGSLVYAELGTMMPASGGEYYYLCHTYKPLHRFWGPLPSFIYAWLNILLQRSAAISILCLSCSRYTVYPILSFFHVCMDPESVDSLVKIVAAAFLGKIFSKSITDYIILTLFIWSILPVLTVGLNGSYPGITIRLQNVFAFTKVSTIALLIGCGIYQMALGNHFSCKKFECLWTA